MKKIIVLLLIISFAGACSSNDGSSEPMVNTKAPMFPLTGTFVNAPGETLVGTVQITKADGVTSLILDETFVANGPDLKIYLSSDAKATDYVSLGSLKMSKGMQTYTVPDGIDLQKYSKYVVVWCEKYSVLFGSAQMM